jgi:hypothetical protein
MRKNIFALIERTTCITEQNITTRTNTVINKIEKMKNDKKRGFITREININPYKIRCISDKKRGLCPKF